MEDKELSLIGPPSVAEILNLQKGEFYFGPPSFGDFSPWSGDSFTFAPVVWQ